MDGLNDDDSTRLSSFPDSLTRRERRIARSRSRRTAALVGWFGYGIGVFVVVAAASWLAVRGETPPVPRPNAKETVVAPVVAVRSTSTTAPTSPAPVVAPTTPEIAPTTTTSTTTAPVLSAAVTPAPEPSTP